MASAFTLANGVIIGQIATIIAMSATDGENARTLAARNVPLRDTSPV